MLTTAPPSVSEHKTTFIKRSSMTLDAESQDHLNKFGNYWIFKLLITSKASRPGTPPSDFEGLEESQDIPHAHLDQTLQSLCEFEVRLK